jgi:DNA-binding SARP family transcriptional activator
MALGVRVLGEFESEGLAPQQLGSRKARALLKIPDLGRGRPIAVKRLIECLWPEDESAPYRPEEQAAVLVSRLRAVLGTDNLVRTDGGYRLVYDWLDLAALEELNAVARRRLSAGSYALVRTAAEAALALVRGPQLAGELHSTWATGERAAAERLVAEAQLTAARAALDYGDTEAAADHAAAVFERNPYEESALRLPMEAHTTAGRPALDINGRLGNGSVKTSAWSRPLKPSRCTCASCARSLCPAQRMRQPPLATFRTVARECCPGERGSCSRSTSRWREPPRVTSSSYSSRARRVSARAVYCKPGAQRGVERCARPPLDFAQKARSPVGSRGPSHSLPRACLREPQKCCSRGRGVVSEHVGRYVPHGTARDPGEGCKRKVLGHPLGQLLQERFRPGAALMPPVDSRASGRRARVDEVISFFARSVAQP